MTDYDKKFEEDLEKAQALSLESLALEQFKNKRLQELSKNASNGQSRKTPSGMDVNNERRIFDLIMESTSQQGTSQYFLITPKLVPNLKYTREARVHIVHNGPFVNPDRKWFASKFCNPDSIERN